MIDRTLRVALVEQFLGGSHRSWAEGYHRASRHDVTLFSLPAAHWKWRMRGGHVTVAAAIERAVAAGGSFDRGPFDVVFASSMTDLAGLLGLARRPLAGAAVVLYLHENQLTYPRRPGEPEDLGFAMTNWTSMLAADRVVFNSEFHRRAWFDALPGFLRRLPDHRHGGLVPSVEERSVVLPVGVDLAAIDRVAPSQGGSDTADRPLVLWNQRWEYDKGPDEFATVVERLIDEDVPFDVAIAGERPAAAPAELRRLRAVLGDRLVHDGWAGPDEYRRLLHRVDVVVSTAHHEFFGVALTEAVYAGAFPVVPDRVVYPERIPTEHHERCLYRSADDLADRLRAALRDPVGRRRVVVDLRRVMSRVDWSVVAPRYDDMLASVVEEAGRGS